MTKYGIPYKGSKNKIAKSILEVLPPGRRLVDLFGGGGAVLHCASENCPEKWEYFYYNDIVLQLVELMTAIFKGEYLLKNFHPKWISKEEFNQNKDTSGYVKYIWSFGNDGKTYLYSNKLATAKRKIFDYIVDGIPSDITQGIILTANSIHDRRIEFKQQMHNVGRRLDIEPLERIERLQDFRVDKPLEMHCHDYREYEYIPGDIVYCDIPYELSCTAKTDYGGGFSHADFYQWAESRPYPVYYSSYSRGSVVWQKTIISSMGTGNRTVRNECLFMV